MKQKYIFLESEGDRYFERNYDKPHVDAITHCIAAYIRQRPFRVLEIGCGAGRTLAAIRERWPDCEVMGIDPSIKAVMEAAKHRIPAMQGTASNLPVSPGYDLIIYGFCLYLTDPDDWLLIASEAHHVLATGGHIIIHDFGDFERTRGVPYLHDLRITSWHFNWKQLWLAHPAYELIHQHWTTGDEHPDQQQITILRKNEMKP